MSVHGMLIYTNCYTVGNFTIGHVAARLVVHLCMCIILFRLAEGQCIFPPNEILYKYKSSNITLVT